MKKIFTLLSILTAFEVANAQVNASLLSDFETTKKLTYKDYNGILDTNFVNPLTTGSNTSAICARYLRDTATYDNIKFYAKTKFIDVTPFASSTSTVKISMMIMTTMPVGTRIELQLGSRQYTTYPQGIHSTYTVMTTMKKQWEKITFNYAGPPIGSPSFTAGGSVDKIVVLFNPISHVKDTVYFDNVMGPDIEATVGLQEMKTSNFKISQNVPNPAKDITSINLDLNVSGAVKMTVYDMLGKAVSTPINNDLDAGSHTFTIDTDNMPNGIYFYTVKSGNTEQTRKMVVSK